MNPMVAFAYLVYSKDVSVDIMSVAIQGPVVTHWDMMKVAIDWCTVYLLAPTVGCAWAGWAYTMMTSTRKSIEDKIDKKNA